MRLKNMPESNYHEVIQKFEALKEYIALTNKDFYEVYAHLEEKKIFFVKNLSIFY